MKVEILHQSSNRLRLELEGYDHMSPDFEAGLEDFLDRFEQVKSYKIFPRIGQLAIDFSGYFDPVVEGLESFSFDENEPVLSNKVETIEYKRKMEEKLLGQTLSLVLSRLFLPLPIRLARTVVKTYPFVKKAVQSLDSLKEGKIRVEVLDAVSIVASLLTRDVSTASNIIYLLDLGEMLEEWTYKKSVQDLAFHLQSKEDQVWMVEEDSERQVYIDQVQVGDRLIIRTAGHIPFDGTIVSGEAMINQASFTGESMPVRKTPGISVYAGTIVEEGEIIIQVTSASDENRLSRIVKMIEENEKLKSNLQEQAENMADKLVPYALAGAALTYGLTSNTNKALAFLMADFSCALKLATPLSVLGAMRQASDYGILVKGGKFFESVAEVDTIIFDKTGTLTESKPQLVDVVACQGHNPREILRMAACLEEHFPHSLASAVVQAAKDQDLHHEELHSEVEYIIAHGIVSSLDGKRLLLGSYHFVFEDEKVEIAPEDQDIFDKLPQAVSRLYFAVDGVLKGVLLIEDPLRDEAKDLISQLKAQGIQTIMMTGDSQATAQAVAEELGMDKYYSEVQPEDKANMVEDLRAQGKTVMMIGDGVNDSLALSKANVGISLTDSTILAQEVSDISLSSNNLLSLLTLKEISLALMERIKNNYNFIVIFNGSLIAGGLFGLLQPSTSSLLHNMSTLAISLKSYGPLTLNSN